MLHMEKKNLMIFFNVCTFSAFDKELSHVKNNPEATVIIRYG